MSNSIDITLSASDYSCKVISFVTEIVTQFNLITGLTMKETDLEKSFSNDGKGSNGDFTFTNDEHYRDGKVNYHFTYAPLKRGTEK